MDKKAFSPLQSTLLLLVLSIIIGIVVMTWGRNYVEQAAQKQVTAEQNQVSPSLYKDIDDRLARGEITQQQYDKIKQVLISQNS